MIADLLPAYFALVMATGVIATAAITLGWPLLAWPLFVIAAIAYGVLWALNVVRFVRYRDRFVADLLNHARAPGFFTFVAATGVLGTAVVAMLGRRDIGAVFWVAGVLLWILVMYSFFAAVITREEKPSLEAGINGAWLIATVATQSIAVLGSFVAGEFGSGREIVLFVSLAMFLLGAMLYLSIITLIFYRFTFVRLASGDLAPPYWITMGAVAISTLGGAALLLQASDWRLVRELQPFIAGLTLLFWATATWWIPLLLVLGFWRHGLRREPLRYDPQYWAMVFPLGMYSLCTLRLSQALDAPWLLPIPTLFFWLALVAWIATFLGLVRRLAGSSPIYLRNTSSKIR